MARGGKRPGAGRKRGGRNPRTLSRLKLVEEATAGGITPLELMLRHMRDLWDEGTKDSKAAAAKLAVDVAGFVHPRLSSIDMTNDQLVEHIIRIPAKARDAETWLEDYMQPTTNGGVQ
jgi:hypothetical protein